MKSAARLARRARTLARTLAVLALLGGSACAPAPPDVVVVTFDTTRHDRLGFAGDPEARTPVLDALAERGLVFERAYATSPVTLPSHTTLFSGVDPRSHGVHDNGRHRVPESITTLAERLRDAGWETAAFVSAFVLDPRFGLDQGFATYRSETRPDAHPLSFAVPQRSAEAVTDDALAWLAKRKTGRPCFVWVHYYDPHQPNRARPGFEELGDAYASEIAYADAQLGRLLDAVAQAGDGREALVVFTADHGEGLGAHGELTHGLLAYDATLHVPLVLAGPGVPAGVRSQRLARQIDVVPTILDALGLEVPSELPGRSLLAEDADAPDPSQNVDVANERELWDYFESRGPVVSLGWAPLEGVRTARWKYTARPAPAELYDVIADPNEERNVIASEPEVLARMRALHEHAMAGRSAEAPAPEALPPETARLLRALGYVDAPTPFAPDRTPDPRATVRVHGWVEEARARALAGDYDEAVETLEVIAQSAPVRALALRTLAPIYSQLGRREDAVRAHRESYLASGSPDALEELAGALLLAGRPGEALRALDEGNARGPAAELLRAVAWTRLGRIAEADAAVDAALPGAEQRLAHLRERARLAAQIPGAQIPGGIDVEARLRALLAEAPADPILRSQLGYQLALAGDASDADEALALLRDGARGAPEELVVQANLGWGAFRLGHGDEAIRALDRVVSADPGRVADRARLGFALLETGRVEEGHDALREALAVQPGADWAPRARALLGDAGPS